MGGKSGGGGKGGDAEIPQEVIDAAIQMQDIGEEKYKLGLPLFETGSQQALDLFQTGSTDALKPAIASTVESTRSAQSQGMTDVRENATKAGLTGTSLQEALAGSRAGAESAVASVPSQFTLPFLNQAAGPAFNLMQEGMQGTQQAGALGASFLGTGQGGKSGGGMMAGAASGASAGMMFGPYGALIGAGVGALSASQ